MAKRYPELDPNHQEFIRRQPVFFVATAPSGPGGHVNLSPKGQDTFRVLDPHRVAYLDLTGSGNETSGHVLQNGRITLMFCAFSGSPLILRIYGEGTIVLPGSAEWETLQGHFAPGPGVRQIVHVMVREVQTSCGYGVPLLDYRGDRDTLTRWADQLGPAGLDAYRRTGNASTLDGLPTPIGLVCQADDVHQGPSHGRASCPWLG